jgi:uncharacterized protein (DUF1330 family)
MATYFVVNATVTDPEMLVSYLAAVPATFEGSDLEVLVATNDAETIEGEPAGRRVVVLKFPNDDSFRTWYDSPASRDVIGMRLESTDGFAVLADGFDVTNAEST